MKIFEPDFNITSAKKPIAKMIISVLVIITLMNRGHIYDIQNGFIRVIETIMCTLFGTYCIFCVYLSIAELINLWEKKSDAKIDCKNVKTTKYSVDELVQMAEENDVLIIKLIYQGKMIKVGAASDLKPGSSEFFDKQYFIEEKEFKSIDEFKIKLEQYAHNGSVDVYTLE